MSSSTCRNLSLAVVLAYIFIFMAATSFAQQKKAELYKPAFYSGPVVVQSVTGTIELRRDEAPTARLDVKLYQASESRHDISIRFRGSEPTKASLEPRTTHMLTLAPVIQRSGNPKGPQTVRADLTLEVDGLLMAEPMSAVDVTILLPQNVPALIRSNTPLKTETVGDRSAYRLTRQRVYLTELVLVYTVAPVTLIIEKAIEPTAIDKGKQVTLTLNIRNVGSADAVNVLLRDNFDPRDFSGEGEGFKLYAGKENDRRLLWSRTIDRIPKGDSASVKYSVNPLASVCGSSLNAVTGSIGGELVGISNKIMLGKCK